MDRTRNSRRVAEAGRGASGLHSFRVSLQQRAHLAAFLILFFALPLCAQSDISFNPNITSSDFQKFSRIVAQGIYASPIQPAGASGLLRFDIGVAVTGVEIDENASYWTRAVGDDWSTGGYVGVPRLVVSKGLGSAAISGSYARLGDSDITTYGGSLDVPIIDGGFVKPTLAARATYSTLKGEDIYDLNVYGVEAFLGKGFGPVVVYGGYGQMRSDAKGTIPATTNTPAVHLTDKSTFDRMTLGVRINLVVPKITIEATQAEVRSYSAKVSFGF
jgi:hypothetical protein